MATDLEGKLSRPQLTARECLQLRRRVRAQTAERRRLEALSAQFADRYGAVLGAAELATRQGLILWLLGRREAALGLLEPQTGSGLARFVLGALAEELGDLEQALALWREAGAQGLASAELAALVAAALRQLERHDEARAELERARAQFGESPELLAEAGALTEAAGDPEAALALYERGLAREPNHAGCAFRAAVLHDRRGDAAEAMRLYRVCTQPAASYVSAMLNQGMLHEDRSELEEAIARYRAVLRVHPNHVRARLLLRDALAALDERYDETERKESERREQLLRTAIIDFDLSVRARNCLVRMNIRALGDLVARTESELLAHKNFGEVSLRQIKQILESKGLTLGMGRQDGERIKREVELDEDVSPEQAEILTRPISALGLSVRSRKCMARLGIETIGDLTRRTEEELTGVRNFGQTSLDEVRGKLAGLGLQLRAAPEA